MNGAFHVPVYFDYIATFAWALSGAIVGLRKHFDIVGVFVLALLTSMGGSILRDGVFLQRPPPVLTDLFYLPLILAATLLAAIFRHRIANLRMIDTLVGTIDAIGTPAFAVVGLQLALGAGIPLHPPARPVLHARRAAHLHRLPGPHPRPAGRHRTRRLGHHRPVLHRAHAHHPLQLAHSAPHAGLAPNRCREQSPAGAAQATSVFY